MDGRERWHVLVLRGRCGGLFGLHLSGGGLKFLRGRFFLGESDEAGDDEDPFLIPGDDAHSDFVPREHRDFADEVEVGG